MIFLLTPPLQLFFTNIFNMTIYIYKYIYIYIYIVISIKIFIERERGGIGREKRLYQIKLTKISAGTKPQRFRYWY
jgi:hypothetical protein